LVLFLKPAFENLNGVGHDDSTFRWVANGNLFSLASALHIAKHWPAIYDLL
jgi:hypothetical protein